MRGPEYIFVSQFLVICILDILQKSFSNHHGKILDTFCKHFDHLEDYIQDPNDPS